MGKAGCSSWLLDTHAWQIVLTATGKKAGAAEKGAAKRGAGAGVQSRWHPLTYEYFP